VSRVTGHAGKLRIAATAALLLALSAVHSAEPAASGADTGLVTVLGAGCQWRKHYTFLPPRLSEAAAKTAGAGLDKDSRTKAIARELLGIVSAPPPPEWIQPEFEDSGWVHTFGKDLTVGDGRAPPS